MLKSNRITPVEVRTINNVAIGSQKVADHEQTLIILKIVCIGVAISTVASTATFAAIISNQANRIEIIERAFEHAQIKNRMVKVESVADTYKATLTHKEAQTKYLEDRLEKNANQTASVEATIIAENESLKLRMTKLEESNGKLATQFESLVVLNSSVMQLNVLAKESNNRSQIRDARLSHIEESMNSRLSQVEESMNYLGFEGVIDNKDRIRLINESLTAVSNTSQVLHLHLASLETKIATIDTAVQNNLAEIIEHDDKIGLLNDSMAARVLNMESAQSFCQNLSDLELKVETMQLEIKTNHNNINSTILDTKQMNESTWETISMLDNRLTNIAAMIPESYYVFSAYNLSASTPSTGSTLVFTRTLVNQVGVYNTSTGTFTAPCDGLFEFHATLSASVANIALYVEFNAGGTAIGMFNVLDYDHWISSSGSAIGRLLKGTQVYLRVTLVNPGFRFIEDVYRMSTFSGHLISK